MDSYTALQNAKAAAGGNTKLAHALGITSNAVCQWRRVPIMRVHDVESLTGVSRFDLRPDIFRRRPTRARKARLKPTNDTAIPR